MPSRCGMSARWAQCALSRHTPALGSGFLGCNGRFGLVWAGNHNPPPRIVLPLLSHAFPLTPFALPFCACEPSWCWSHPRHPGSLDIF